jgi:hypothetical protein
MLGLLGSALAGGGEAVQKNAQSKIEEMRAKALVELRQDFKTSEREAEQDFTTGERIAGNEFTTSENVKTRDFRAGEGAADRAQQLSLTQMRESGANRRAAAGQNNWETLRSADGGIIRFNPQTGESEKTDLPGSVLLGDEGDLSDVEKERLNLASNRIKDIRDLAADEMREPTEREAEEVLTLTTAVNKLLNPSGTGGSGEQTVLEKWMAGEGGYTGGTGEGGSGGTDAPDLTYQQVMDGIQQESGQQSVSDVLSDVGLLVSEIKLSEGASSGGLIGPGPRGQGRAKEKGDKARAEAQKLLPTLVEMYNATKNEDERALLRKRIGELGEIGVTPAKP